MLLNKIRISVKFILWILYDSFNYKNRCFHKIGYFTKSADGRSKSTACYFYPQICCKRQIPHLEHIGQQENRGPNCYYISQGGLFHGKTDKQHFPHFFCHMHDACSCRACGFSYFRFRGIVPLLLFPCNGFSFHIRSFYRESAEDSVLSYIKRKFMRLMLPSFL